MQFQAVTIPHAEPTALMLLQHGKLCSECVSHPPRNSESQSAASLMQPAPVKEYCSSKCAELATSNRTAGVGGMLWPSQRVWLVLSMTGQEP
ncbi:hypothetical protein VTK56DRAFT_7895 [Thermocarpiscus australiensis]